MKIHVLLASAALLASPAVFAEDDLCAINLQEIENNMATNTVTLGEPARSQVEELTQKAKQAQQAGEEQTANLHGLTYVVTTA